MQDPNITRRDVSFELDPKRVPRDWMHDGDAFTTTFMDALSILFPEGERFFVESVKQARGKLPATPELEALRKQIVGFIGQEAMHGREHRALNEMLVDHGYTEAPALEQWLRGLLITGRKVFSPASQLAITAGLEHFTAILAEKLLSDPRMQAEFDPAIRAMWMWHALEESEHKTVAYDVYEATGGGYARRVAIMALITAIFFAVLAAFHARLMMTRKIAHKPWKWMSGLGRMWIYPGFFGRLIPAYFRYYMPGFHPKQNDNAELTARWRELLFGARGELTPQLKAA